MDEKTVQVSIGLPVYNGEKFLAETLESILAQSYTDFELIIADNCSTDATEEICRKYAAFDHRIRYIRNERNLGVAPNYNLTFALASGEYFKWADYDDLLAPEFLAKSITTLERHPEAALCYPRTYLIDDAGHKLHSYDPLPDTSSAHPAKRFGNLILAPDHYAVQASGLMRAVKVRQTVMHGAFPSSDEVFLASMALQGSFIEMPERLMSVRVHAGQSTKGILASERARVLFFDTSLKDRVVLLKWLYFKAALHAIRSAPISSAQKGRSYLFMARWLCVPQHFRSMSKDLLLAIHERWPVFKQLHRETLDAANQLDV